MTAIIASSCVPIKVLSDYEENLNFDKYTTYKVEQNKSVFPKDANPIQHLRLEAGIKNKMKELGFIESDDPELLVRYFVKKEIHEAVVHKGEEPDNEMYKYNFEIYQYKEGTMVLDFYDAKEKKALWHGVLSRTVKEDLKTAEKRINRNVNAIFDKFAKEVGRDQVL